MSENKPTEAVMGEVMGSKFTTPLMFLLCHVLASTQPFQSYLSSLSFVSKILYPVCLRRLKEAQIVYWI